MSLEACTKNTEIIVQTESGEVLNEGINKELDNGHFTHTF